MKNKKQTIFLIPLFILAGIIFFGANSRAADSNLPDPANPKFQSLCECVTKENKTAYSNKTFKSETDCISYCKNYPFFRFRYTNDGTNWFYGAKSNPGNQNNQQNSQTNQNNAPQSNAAGTIEFANPLKFTTVKEAVNALLGNLMGIIASISIVFIVIGGIMYMLSAGNENMIDKAKATISAAVIGLAISLAAPTFLKEIQNILGGKSAANADDWVNKAYTIKDIVISVLNLLLSVVGILAIIGMVIGGVFYLTAYGDEDRIDKGKKVLTASLIGIAVAFGAVVLVRQVAGLLGVK